jgi:hypothetical protein
MDGLAKAKQLCILLVLKAALHCIVRSHQCMLACSHACVQCAATVDCFACITSVSLLREGALLSAWVQHALTSSLVLFAEHAVLQAIWQNSVPCVRHSQL